MAVYHQIGHHSNNLVTEPDLGEFRGAILSPVNYSPEQTRDFVSSIQAREGFQTILDPQLYYPRAERGRLPEWGYFPADVETADISSAIWWQGIIDDLVETCEMVHPSAVCSPAFAPGSFANDYFSQITQIGNRLAKALEGTGIRPVQTLLVGMGDLSAPTRPLEIASIVSRTNADEIYLVFIGSTVPRRELSETEEIKGAMRLIAALEKSGMVVTVGFCSTDFVLWKAAGASNFATGKYFNLRRFTKERFDEPTDAGGGQLPYWFEESLMGFLRESDVLRVAAEGLLSPASLGNPFGNQILERIKSVDDKPGPWLGLSWRHYLYAFADLERRLDTGESDVGELLKEAERNWLKLEDANVLMEEPRNDGTTWIRPWRRALLEFAN